MVLEDHIPSEVAPGPACSDTMPMITHADGFKTQYISKGMLVYTHCADDYVCVCCFRPRSNKSLLSITSSPSRLASSDMIMRALVINACSAHGAIDLLHMVLSLWSKFLPHDIGVHYFARS